MILITVQPEPVYNCTLQRRHTPPPHPRGPEPRRGVLQVLRGHIGTTVPENKTYITYKHAVNL